MNRKDKVSFLMDEIGNVDEKYLEEALSYSGESRKETKKRKLFRLPPAAIISVSAACLTIAFAVLLGLVLVRLPIFRSATSQGSEDPSAVLPAETGDRLSRVLTETKTAERTDAVETEDFFGEPRLVWQTAEGSYGVLRLSSSQSTTLKRLMAESEKDPVRVAPEETQDGRCQVWLLNGDGTVVTPYLPLSEGNVCCASLFNYDPEILPDPSLADYVSRLAGNA